MRSCSSIPVEISPSPAAPIQQAFSSVSTMFQCRDPSSETHLWTLDCKFRPTIDYLKSPQDLSHVALSGSGVGSPVPQMRPPRSSAVSAKRKGKCSHTNSKYLLNSIFLPEKSFARQRWVCRIRKDHAKYTERPNTLCNRSDLKHANPKFRPVQPWLWPFGTLH